MIIVTEVPPVSVAVMIVIAVPVPGMRPAAMSPSAEAVEAAEATVS
jgi:hypothetical protein